MTPHHRASSPHGRIRRRCCVGGRPAKVEVGHRPFRIRGGWRRDKHFGPKGGKTYHNEARYLDIVQNERIVSAGVMTTGGIRIFAGLMTVEFTPAGKGCRMVMTEQGVFLDGHDVPANHEGGWNSMLDNLGEELKRDRAAA